MMLRATLFLIALLVAGCSRPSPVGRYETRTEGANKGQQFSMTLEIGANGQASLVTAAKLGNPQLDRSVEATMSIPQAKWVHDDQDIVLSGNRGDGRAVVHRFVTQSNGDLIWKENGARFYRSR